MSLGFNNSRFLKGHRSTKIKTVKANDSWNGIPKEAVSIVPRSHKVGRFFLPVFTRCSTQSSDAYAPYGLTIAYGEKHSAERRENQLKHSSAWYKNRKRSYHRCGDEPGDAVSGACLGTVFITFILERGTNSILDKKDGGLLSGITAIKILAKNASHTNGGGILYTVHDNLLVGPNAVETWEVEAPGPPGLRRDVKRLFLGFTDVEEGFSKNVAKDIRRITHRYGAWV